LIIEEIFLKNLRIYEEYVVDLTKFKGSRVVAIVGPNGVGKTTLLESIIYLTRGFTYGQSPKNYIRKGATQGVTRVSFYSQGGKGLKHEALAVISINESTRVYLNGKETDRDTIQKYLDCYWFLPQDIDLVLVGDDVRRNFLDKIIRMIDHSSKKLFSAYQTALSSRNQLLQNLKEERNLYNNTEIDAVEDVLADLAAEITRLRLELVNKLNKKIKKLVAGINDFSELNLKYKPVVNLTSDDLRESFRENLYVSRGTDVISSSTSVGPHRDLVKIDFRCRDARYEASYGERKLIALLLKLAGFMLLKENSTASTVFLADDIFSELDLNRRLTVMDLLLKLEADVIFTATEIPHEIMKNDILGVVQIA
jgi:DNA replication and repair protein RecF